MLLAQQLPERAEFGGAATNLLARGDAGGGPDRAGEPGRRRRGRRPRPRSGGRGHRGATRPAAARGHGEPVSLDAWEVIEGGDARRGHVVVADWRSDWVGLGVARLLAARGSGSRWPSTAPAPGSACSSTSATASWPRSRPAADRRRALGAALRRRRRHRLPPARADRGTGHARGNVRPGARAAATTPDCSLLSALEPAVRSPGWGTAWLRAASRRRCSRACRLRAPSDRSSKEATSGPSANAPASAAIGRSPGCRRSQPWRRPHPKRGPTR